MEAAFRNTAKRRLSNVLQKSLGKLSFQKSPRTSMVEKNKIKKTAVTAIQGFLKSELKRTNTRTYDWYFFKDAGAVYHIQADRNNLSHNRYFVVDHEYVPIKSTQAFKSTAGQQRVRQYDITSKEIGDIISSSAKIFADMMRITVSEKEDAKINKAYHTVDEKKIITVTIALPVAIIGAAEAVPLMVMASKSSAFSSMTSSIGKAFVLNSGRQMGINAGVEFGSQYLSNGIANNEWGSENFRSMDKFDLGAKTLFGKGGGVFLSSLVDWKQSGQGPELNSFENFTTNMVFGGLKYKANSVLTKGLGKHLTDVSPSLGKIYLDGAQFTIKTTINSFSKRVKEKNEKSQ